MIGVQFMGDLFHESAPDEWIASVVAIASMAPQHTFLILTKRTARARALFEGVGFLEDLEVAQSMAFEEYGHHVFDVHARRTDDGRAAAWMFTEDGLPPNIFWGTTVENQARADERIPDLLAIPGRHFLSVEPMLGPINLSAHLPILGDAPPGQETRWFHEPWLHPEEHPPVSGVIVGGEKLASGRPGRPTRIEWVRDLRDQCVAAGVPLMVKQLEAGGRVVGMPEVDGRVWDQVAW